MSGMLRFERALRVAQRANPLLGLFERQLARNERATEDEIHLRSERALRRVLRVAAARSPYYRALFAENRVDPRSIRVAEDLSVLPPLQRGDLVEGPQRFLTVPRGVVRQAHTSGTSGEPAVCYRTFGSIIYEVAALERQLRWHGLRPPIRSLVVREDFGDADAESFVRQRGSYALQISARAFTPEHIGSLLARVERFGPAMIEGWPSRLADLAEALLGVGKKLSVAAVRSSSEAVLPHQRGLFRSAFGGTLIDLYGQTERVAMGGNCERGGFHLFTDYSIVELLPTEAGSDRLEIVATPLHNFGFPLFRYRTGDFVRAAARGECACGRPFPLIHAIEGRLESRVEAADGRKIPLPSAVLDDLVGIREAQLVQHRPGVFEIRVVPGRSFDERAVEDQVRANVERLIGPGQVTTVTVVPTIGRSGSVKRSAVVVLDEAHDGHPTRA